MALLGAILGGLLGVVQGLFAWRSQSQMSQMQVPWMPQVLQGMPELYRAFQILGATPSRKTELIARVARRCSTLFTLHHKIQNSDPQTVAPSIGPAAIRLKNEALRVLQDYYRSSNVSVVASEGSIVPINVKMREAHYVVLRALQDETHNIGLCVAECQREKAAIRQGKLLDKGQYHASVSESKMLERGHVRACVAEERSLRRKEQEQHDTQFY
jgi:hypothetical protein